MADKIDNALSVVSGDALTKALPAEDLAALRRINHEIHNPSMRMTLMEDISLLINSADEASGPRFFPKPEGYSVSEWNDLKKRLLIIVNLLKASVRKVRSRVYGGNQSRVVVANPYEDEIKRFLGGRYALDMRDWFTNRVTYSNAACIVAGRRMKNGRFKLDRWLPDPMYTYLAADETNTQDYLALAEVSPCGKHVQFVTRHAEGMIFAGVPPVVLGAGDVPEPGKSFVKITNRGFFPGVVAHGETRGRRCAYSEPPFKDAVKFTVAASDIMFNGRLLQKMQTKGLLWIAGQLELNASMDPAEMMKQGFVFTDSDGKVQFLSPESNISGTLEILAELIEIYSVTHAIPVDDLNPTSSKGTSAEEAQRRAEPHLSLTREFAEMAIADEQELVVRATAELEWIGSRGPVDLDDVRDVVETEIALVPPMRPLQSLEDANVSLAGFDRGIFLPEDMAVLWHEGINDRKKKMVVESIRDKKEKEQVKDADKSSAGPDEQ